MFEYTATIERVIDGDTVVAMVDLGFSTYSRQHLRLDGIDAPEIRGAERSQGLESKAFLQSLVFGEELIVKTRKDKTGKYGRYLATLWMQVGDDDSDDKFICINDRMVDTGHATRY